MTRNQATKILRDLLDEQNLRSWHIRLSSDMRNNYLGMCSYKDKTIVLNTFYIDTCPDLEIINTIRHEVAHALCPNHGHDNVWSDKARSLGCDNTMPCKTYALSEDAIDAIRSGADLQVTYEEQVIRTPKYTINKLQDKCEKCGKIAKESSRSEVRIKGKTKIVIVLECGHIIFKNGDSYSDFESLVFDDDPNCKHVWGIGKDRTKCTKCPAKRLYEYQIEGAKAIEKNNGRFGVFDEQGLGKTIQALAYLKFHPEAFPLLWVTKSKIKYQHGREMIRVLGKQYAPFILTKSKDKLHPGFNSYIISYDLFRRFDSLEIFKEAGIKTIVLDECQAIMNPDSARTGALRAVVRDIPNVIPTSGTPWKNKGSEFFVVLNLLDPKMFHTYSEFVKWEINKYYVGNKEKLGGFKNPKGFAEKTKHILIRRERKDVLPELPLINRTRLTVEVPEHARSVYNAELKKLKAIWDDAVISGTEDSFATQSALSQTLMVMKQVVGLAKVDSTIEQAQEFLEDTDRKLVIFVHHIACAEIIFNKMSTWCAENNIAQPLRFSGGMGSEEVYNTQMKFNGPDYRLLIASTLAAGEGLNLQTCSDCIMHERQWNPANEEQAEGRFIRIGQQANQVNATYVHGDNTVDTELDKMVEKKRIEFHNSMNKGELATWNESDMIKDLVKNLVSGIKK